MTDWMDILYRILLVVAIGAGALFITRLITGHLYKTNGTLHVRFTIQTVRLLIIVLCLFNIYSIFEPNLDLHRVLLSGSALVVAIVGFAAQPAISDLINGFLISINKPFEVGDRIVVEGQEPAVVEDITLRHTVLRIYDGIRIIVPNSQINTRVIRNTSYKQVERGIHLEFSVSYDTDIKKATNIIRDCVAESPYTLSVERNGIREDSGPVYLLRFSDSAVVLETTIWVKPPTDNYVAATDVNTRVFDAFRSKGIEIPFPYINVVERGYIQYKPEDNKPIETGTAHRAPRMRHHRTDTVRLGRVPDALAAVTAAVEHFSGLQRLERRDAMQLQLLSEESLIIVRGIVEDAHASFWIEGSGRVYRIHWHLSVPPDKGDRKRLIALSSSGVNEATGFRGRIRELLTRGLQDKQESTWSIHDDPDGNSYGESILGALADDIRVTITKDDATLLIEKKLEEDK